MMIGTLITLLQEFQRENGDVPVKIRIPGEWDVDEDGDVSAFEIGQLLVHPIDGQSNTIKAEGERPTLYLVAAE